MSYRAVSGVQSTPLAQRGPRARRVVLNEVPLLERGLEGMGSVTSQPLRLMRSSAARYPGRIFMGGIGDTAAVAPAAVPDATDTTITDPASSAQAQRIITMLQAQDRARQITLYIGIASALFAAARLGIIAIPHVKRRFAGGGED